MSISPNTVKICSLRQPVHAEYVAEAGADLFGLIFAEARRQVTLPVAREIVDEAHRLQSGLRAVGAFVDHRPDDINLIADAVGLDLVQLHRPEILAERTRIERPVLLVIHTGPATTLESVSSAAAAIVESGSSLAGIIVDGFKAGSHGGTGTNADWAIAREIASTFPVLLAGGLHPENVGQAIDAVGPAGVDVSSGVETDGEKDRAKIIAFVREARSAMAGASLGRVNVVPLSQST
jgi:phosphoribosylanthranilate isomerase